MKSTGIIRRMDELGRVVIPIEIRNQFNIASGCKHIIALARQSLKIIT